MKRKVAKIGPSTLMISLPTKWVKANNVKKGDEINIIQNNKELIINSQNEQGLGKITILIPSEESFVKRMMFLPYIKGYNIIKLKLKQKELMTKIFYRLNYMIGFYLNVKIQRNI